MTGQRPADLGCALLLCLAACAEPTRPDHSNLVSIRVAGFVESAGIT
jgi:hypothetical protein